MAVNLAMLMFLMMYMLALVMLSIYTSLIPYIFKRVVINTIYDNIEILYGDLDTFFYITETI
ncbi:MAG: hypothetical protein ACTSR8_02615 [Promethearchaeota archaeon]